MATHTLLFFMRPEEFSSVLWEAAGKFSITLIFDHYGSHGRQSFREVAERPGTLAMADGSAVHRVYLSLHRPEPWMIEGEDPTPAAWGWLDIDVPTEVGSILFLAHMAARSDWWDEQKRQVLDNPESLSLFRKVAPLFRKRLKRPVWSYNVALGGEPGMTRNIWYSEGAAEWVRDGGQLRQGAVAWDRPTNSRFLIDKPTTPVQPPTVQGLIQEFLSLPADENLKWAIGLALSTVADDDDFEQVVEIAQDQQHGTARQMVVTALGKMRNERAVDVLIGLLTDQEVAEYAIIALGRLGAVKARPHIQPFLAHPSPLVRIRSAQALASIDKRK